MCRQMPYVWKSVFSYWYRNLLFFKISHSAHSDKMSLIWIVLLNCLILNCIKLLTSFTSYKDVYRLCSYHGGHYHWQVCTQRNTCDCWIFYSLTLFANSICYQSFSASLDIRSPVRPVLSSGQWHKHMSEPTLQLKDWISLGDESVKSFLN